MARYIQGSCGVANIDNDDHIRAEDVTYDNSAGLFPPGTDDVQTALEAAGGGGGGAAEMTPAVAGTAYGLQDTTNLSNLLGRDVNAGAVSSTGRFLPQSVGTTQQAVYSFAIYDENSCVSDGSTAVTNAITQVNNCELANCQISASSLSATNTLLSDTVVNNALVCASTSQLQGGATVRNDALYLNDSQLKGAQLEQACLHVTGLVAPGASFDGGTMMGSVTQVAVSNMRESMFLASNAGSPIDQQGRQSLYVGNQSTNETINDRECWLSSYDRFFLRTLRNDSSPPDVCYYEPGSAEITYGPAPVATLPLKQPNAAGSQFGISSLANGSEVNGRGSFAGYAAGPAQLTGVTAVGNNLFAINNPSLTSFSNSIVIGRSHTFTSAQTVSDSLLCANVVTGAGISQINSALFVVPKASSLSFTYAGSATGPCIVSSGAIICVSDPLYSTVLSSGGTVTPAGSNLVLCANQGSGSVSMVGSGNSLVLSAGNSVTYNWPVGVSNTCVLHNGTSIVLPSASSQLCSNHTSFRMPNYNSVATADVNTLPLGFNSATGLVAPTLSALLSRVYRAVGTTVAGGTVVFTPGGSINVSTAGYAFNATVRNASATVAYVAQIQAVTAVSVTVAVYQSTTVVLASPSMVPAPAGIIVHLSMCY